MTLKKMFEGNQNCQSKVRHYNGQKKNEKTMINNDLQNITQTNKFELHELH